MKLRDAMDPAFTETIRVRSELEKLTNQSLGLMKTNEQLLERNRQLHQANKLLKENEQLMVHQSNNQQKLLHKLTLRLEADRQEAGQMQAALYQQIHQLQMTNADLMNELQGAKLQQTKEASEYIELLQGEIQRLSSENKELAVENARISRVVAESTSHLSASLPAFPHSIGFVPKPEPPVKAVVHSTRSLGTQTLTDERSTLKASMLTVSNK